MDRSHLSHIQSMWRKGTCEKAFLLLDVVPGGALGRDVEDPYYDGPEAFASVLKDVELACTHIVAAIKAGHAIATSTGGAT